MQHAPPSVPRIETWDQITPFPQVHRGSSVFGSLRPAPSLPSDTQRPKRITSGAGLTQESTTCSSYGHSPEPQVNAFIALNWVQA